MSTVPVILIKVIEGQGSMLHYFDISQRNTEMRTVGGCLGNAVPQRLICIPSNSEGG